LNATGIVAISAGGDHSLALKENGTILAWGRDHLGQLGDDATLANQPTPVPVSSATGIVAISAGLNHSLALKGNGTMLSWGLGALVGDDTIFADQPTPIAVLNATGIVAISAGGNHSLALKDNGTMLAWGFDDSGQLGDDATLALKFTPVVVSSATDIVAISAGNGHSLALKDNGTMLGWGADFTGQLGNDSAIINQPIPVSVLLGAGITIRLP
jgi:alpha-tubulin suppressor-like RCC1 family protein